MSSFQGKVIAITGAGSGIGSAIAHHLAQQGARLSITDISESSLSNTTKVLHPLIGTENLLTSVADIRDPTAINQWIETTIQHFGRLDGVVNAAGVHPRESGKEPIWNVSDEDWAFAQDVNVRGTLNVVRAALKHMVQAVSGKEMATGSVVVFGSNSSVAGMSNLSAYTTSKHAVLGLMRAAAMDAAKYNIRVNAVCPGPIDTPMLRSVVPDEQLGGMTGSIPLNRLGKVEEVTGLVAFLLDDHSGFCTGGTYMVDGGMTSC